MATVRTCLPTPTTDISDTSRYQTRGVAHATAASEAEVTKAARSLVAAFDARAPATPTRKGAEPTSHSGATLLWTAQVWEISTSAEVATPSQRLGLAADLFLAQGLGTAYHACESETSSEHAYEPPRSPSPTAHLCPTLLAVLSPLPGASSPAPPARKPKKATAKKATAKARSKADPAWRPGRETGEPTGVTKKAKQPKKPIVLAPAPGGGFRQPRGRPPHDRDNNKMLWDKGRGLWRSEATGEERVPK